MTSQYNVLQVNQLNTASGCTLLTPAPVTDYVVQFNGSLSGGSGGSNVVIRPNGDGGTNYNGMNVHGTSGNVFQGGGATNGMYFMSCVEGEGLQGEMRITKVGTYWLYTCHAIKLSAGGTASEMVIGGGRWNSQGAALSALVFQVDTTVALRRFTGRVSFYGVDS